MSDILSKMYVGLHVQYPLWLSDFNETSIFSTVYRKNSQISNFKKIRPVGAELFCVDIRTDRWSVMTKLIVAFRNFSKALKNQKGIVQ